MTTEFELSAEDRLTRLDDAVCDVLLYVTDNQPQRATRSLAASQQGSDLLGFFNTVKAERAAALTS